MFDVLFSEEKLPVEIAEVDSVHINDDDLRHAEIHNSLLSFLAGAVAILRPISKRQATKATAHKVLEDLAADTASTDKQDATLFHSLCEREAQRLYKTAISPLHLGLRCFVAA